MKVHIYHQVCRERKRKEREKNEADTEVSEVEEPTQKRLKSNSPTKTRSVSNGSETDLSETIVDTCNTSGLTSITDGESDTFHDDDIDLSSLSDSGEDYY